MTEQEEERNEKVDQICECIRKTGGSLMLCSRRAHVSYHTVLSWRARYAYIADALREATMEYEDMAELISQTSILQAAKDGDWRAGLAWAERRRPERWAKTDPRPAEKQKEYRINIKKTVVSRDDFWPENKDKDSSGSAPPNRKQLPGPEHD